MIFTGISPAPALLLISTQFEELIALTGDYRVARAAFDEAVKRPPGRIITLRQKTRLLADSRRPAKK